MTSDALLSTPLYELHVEAGAKLVPFAGYNMPVSYPLGIKAEHIHTRARAGLFDVSHMGQALVSGAEAIADLERLLPIDAAGLLPGQCTYAFFANEEGGVIDDLIVTRQNADTFVLVYNAACKEKDEAHVRSHLSASTEFTPLDDRALLALQGPLSASVLLPFAPKACELLFMQGGSFEIDGVTCFVTRTGYTGEDGFEISIPATAALKLAQMLLQHADVEWIGLGARDSLRLEAGLCLYGHDMDESRSPIDAGLWWAVHKSRRPGADKAGGFIGADAIFARRDTGAAQKRVGFLVDGKAPIREGVELFNDAEECIGIVTSGGFAPSLAAPIAMGYVDTPLAVPGSRVFASLRGKLRPLTVAPALFVPHRYFRG